MGRLASWVAYKQTFAADPEPIALIRHPTEGELYGTSHCGHRRQPAARIAEPGPRARSRLARARRSGLRVRRDRRAAVVQPGLRCGFPRSREAFQANDRSGRRAAVRHARIQPLDSGCAEERARLGSRPWGANSWARKPGAVLGTSPGATGTALAQQHLRNVLAYLDVTMLAQPEMFIKNDPSRIDAQGQIVSDDTRAFLQRFVDRYAAWVRQQAAV